MRIARSPSRSGLTRAPGEPTNTPFSHVSGGGDRHHGHDVKGDTEENSRQRAKP